MKKNKSRTPVLKKMFCVFFSVLSLFILLPTQPGVVAEAYNADYTVIMSVSGTSKALTKNKLYYSPNKTYACVFQSDGNLVVYRHRPWEWGAQVTRDNAIWKSGTNGIAQNGNCYLQKDGNLVVYAANGAPKFSTYHSYSNAKKVELRLDNNGVLRVYYKTSTFGIWDLSWQSTGSPIAEYAVVPANGIRKGVKIKEEPDASLLVGKWVRSSYPQSENSSLTIDFAEDGRLQVTTYDLHCVPWASGKDGTFIGGERFCYIETSSFKDYSGVFTEHRATLSYDFTKNSEDATLIDEDSFYIYINDEGTDLYLNSMIGPSPLNHFTRYESSYLSN